VKQAIICVKRGEFRTSEIATAGFLGTIQQALVCQSLDLLDLFCRSCAHTLTLNQCTYFLTHSLTHSITQFMGEVVHSISCQYGYLHV